MIIRMALSGSGTSNDPYRVDLPTYGDCITDTVTNRAFVTVPDVDVPSDVAGFVTANPVTDLSSPLPNPFPASLARSWSEHLARRYDLGEARWKPGVA